MVFSPSGLEDFTTADPDWVTKYNYNITRLNNTLLKLAALADVDLSGIANGDTLKFDSASGKFKPWHPDKVPL